MVNCIRFLIVGDSFGFGSCVSFGGLTEENGQWINRNPSWVCSIFWGQLHSASWASVRGVITLEHAGTPKEHIPPHSSVSAPTNCTCGPDMLPGKRAYNGDLLTDMLASTWLRVGHNFGHPNRWCGNSPECVSLVCFAYLSTKDRYRSFMSIQTNIIINSVKLLTNIKTMYHDILSYIGGKTLLKTPWAVCVRKTPPSAPCLEVYAAFNQGLPIHVWAWESQSRVKSRCGAKGYQWSW